MPEHEGHVRALSFLGCDVAVRFEAVVNISCMASYSRNLFNTMQEDAGALRSR